VSGKGTSDASNADVAVEEHEDHHDKQAERIRGGKQQGTNNVLLNSDIAAKEDKANDST
jgi:hypothetical protein